MVIPEAKPFRLMVVCIQLLQVTGMNGTTAEWRIGALLKQTKMVKRLTPDKESLLAIADPERIETVNSHLLIEEGYPLSEASPRLILDRLWGCDFLVTYKGYRIVIDLTLDITKITSKLQKLGDLWSHPPIEIDAYCVWVLDPTNIPKSLDAVLAKSIKSGVYFI